MMFPSKARAGRTSLPIFPTDAGTTVLGFVPGLMKLSEHHRADR